MLGTTRTYPRRIDSNSNRPQRHGRLSSLDYSQALPPELQLPGANLSHTFAVNPGRIYYIQVRSLRGTGGADSLTVR